MNDNFAENLAKPCQKADQQARVANVAIQPPDQALVAAAFDLGPGFLALNRRPGVSCLAAPSFRTPSAGTRFSGTPRGDAAHLRFE